MYWLADNPENIYQYNVTVPWNVTNSVLDFTFDVVSFDGNPQGMDFSSNGTRMYFLGNGGDDVQEFRIR